MLTNDQQYAINVHKQVEAVAKKYETEKVKQRQYGAMSHKLPILIHSAGLAQALAFVASRIKPPKDEKPVESPYRDLLIDLASTIVYKKDKYLDENATVQNKDKFADILPEKAREAELEAYILLTQQVLDALVWYKRYAQSILNVDASASEEDAATAGTEGATH